MTITRTEQKTAIESAGKKLLSLVKHIRASYKSPFDDLSAVNPYDNDRIRDLYWAWAPGSLKDAVEAAENTGVALQLHDRGFFAIPLRGGTLPWAVIKIEAHKHQFPDTGERVYASPIEPTPEFNEWLRKQEELNVSLYNLTRMATYLDKMATIGQAARLWPGPALKMMMPSYALEAFDSIMKKSRYPKEFVEPSDIYRLRRSCDDTVATASLLFGNFDSIHGDPTRKLAVRYLPKRSAEFTRETSIPELETQRTDNDY